MLRLGSHINPKQSANPAVPQSAVSGFGDRLAELKESLCHPSDTHLFCGLGQAIDLVTEFLFLSWECIMYLIGVAEKIETVHMVTCYIHRTQGSPLPHANFMSVVLQLGIHVAHLP